MAKAKEIAGLDCAGRADEGARLVLGARLAEVCLLRDAALNFEDAEGVHDMRVATRRLRSALRDFKPYFARPARLRESRAALKALADALGAVRDADVAIPALEELRDEAPEEVKTGINQLIAERRAGRDEARAALVKSLGRDTLARLREEFAEALEEATKPGGKGKHRRKRADEQPAAVSFREAGREVVRARLDEMGALSRSLYRPSKAEKLHEMRIAAKRLRYAMELFAPCFDDALTETAAEVGGLQTSLGELHDCDVWIEELCAALRAPAGGGNGEGEGQGTRESAGGEVEGDEAAGGDGDGAKAKFEARARRAAAVWLLRRFVKRRARHYGDALARWHEWEAGDFFAGLITSLEGPQRPALELAAIGALPAAEAVAADIESPDPAGRES